MEPKRKGATWEPEEQTQLVTKFVEFVKAQALQHQRTEGAISARIALIMDKSAYYSQIQGGTKGGFGKCIKSD